MKLDEIMVTHELSVSDFLAPISDESPCGPWLKQDEVYKRIQIARQSDDPLLPQGDWKIDLKKPNWEEVFEIASGALQSESKDLQLAIWMLESQIHISGFRRVGPIFILIAELMSMYWDEVHPVLEDDDIEYRTNLFNWVNDKISITLSLSKFIPSGLDDIDGYSLFELNRCIRQKAPVKGKQVVGLTVETIRKAMDLCPLEFYQEVWIDLQDAEFGLSYLDSTFESLFKDSAPTLGNVRGVIADLAALVADHAGPLGLFDSENNSNADPVFDLKELANSEADVESNLSGRAQAYAMLRSAAEFLVQDDPHSPVPYLVFKAIDWGRLDTAELYRELFVENRGNLNIFDLLGVEVQADQKAK
jgi:type VI secretion system protein ImpA